MTFVCRGDITTIQAENVDWIAAHASSKEHFQRNEDGRKQILSGVIQGGDMCGCSPGFVDIKAQVASWYKEHILKVNPCPHVN